MNKAQFRSVLITGANSGIGLEVTRLLANSGFHVFAGVRTKEAEDTVKSISTSNVTPVQLDITDQNSVKKCFDFISSNVANNGLFGLVNNAGIGLGGPIEYMSTNDLRRQFEVNIFGTVAVTQAFLPLLRQKRGRIVNISSMAGKMATPLVGAYSSSKFALESISDCLRVELRRAKVRVSIIEPGMVATPMHDKGLSADKIIFGNLPEEGKQYYEKASYLRFETHDKLLKHAISPERVARIIKKCLQSPNPKSRYVVGIDARMFLTLNWLLPRSLMDRLLAALMGL
jgi:NAD(P)-dependent dehydrogenase (short-subunit alcohol dehydrogenase family)